MVPTLYLAVHPTTTAVEVVAAVAAAAVKDTTVMVVAALPPRPDLASTAKSSFRRRLDAALPVVSPAEVEAVSTMPTKN